MGVKDGGAEQDAETQPGLQPLVRPHLTVVFWGRRAKTGGRWVVKGV